MFVDEPVVVGGEFGDDLVASVGWQRRIIFPVGEQQHVVKVTGFHWSAFREWYRCRWYAAHASRHCWQGGCWLRVWRLYADTVPQGALIGLPILPVLAPCLARHWRWYSAVDIGQHLTINGGGCQPSGLPDLPRR